MARFIFSIGNTNGPVKLYSTDGTAGGTTAIQAPGLGSLGSFAVSVPDFSVLGNKVYFLGIGKDVGPIVYGTDGKTASPSAPIKGVGGQAIPDVLQAINGHLLMSGGIKVGLPGLWSSTNGVNFTELESGAGAISLAASHGLLFFGSDLSLNGVQSFWRTDGTAAGTKSITVPNGVMPNDFLPVANGRTVFVDQGLWVTDGTAGGTSQIADGALGTKLDSSGGASTGTKAVFAAIDSGGRESVWSTDGTSSGTVELLTNPLSDRSPAPGGFASLGNRVVFTRGSALYATDGTVAGTVNLSGTSIIAFGVAGSNVFFTRGASLFVSDGSTGGTHPVAVPGLASVNSVASFTAVGNSVVFEGTDTSGKPALFASDGTAAGTSEVALPAGVVPSATSVIGPLPAPPSSGIVTLGGGAQDYVAAAGTTVQAGSGSDTISARAGQVTVLGSSGRILFLGGSGSSSVSGATGSVTAFGGAGGGHLSGGSAGYNILVAQGGNTTLTGATGGDQLFGSAAGNDVLNLGAGREIVVGGGGNTTVNGGTGSSVIFTDGGSTSVLGDSGGGSAGGDTIVGGSGTLRVAAQHGDAIFGGRGALAVTGSAAGARADSVIGGAGALSVIGHGANMLVVGGTTTSNIFTGDGASLIFSGSGATTVTGGAGSMRLVLGSGGGTYREGSGASHYDAVKGSTAGLDIVAGFRPGADTIALHGYAAGDVQVVRSGGSTVINLAGGARIELLGVADPGHGIIGA